MEIKFNKINLLEPDNYGPTAEIVSLLRVAADVLERGNGEDERAAWRVADAGLRLRRHLETLGLDHIIGLNSATGLGAVLPQEPIR